MQREAAPAAGLGLLSEGPAASQGLNLLDLGGQGAGNFAQGLDLGTFGASFRGPSSLTLGDMLQLSPTRMAIELALEAATGRKSSYTRDAERMEQAARANRAAQQMQQEQRLWLEEVLLTRIEGQQPS